MKKFLGILLVFGMMSGVAYAATTDSIQLLVIVGGTDYSVDIASTSKSFGTVSLGAQQSVFIGTVSNNGNIVSDWEITGLNASNGTDAWTLAAAVTDDTYGLMIGTSASNGAVEPTWNPAGGTPVSSVTLAATEATTGFGRRLISGANVGLWSKISMPTTSLGSGTYSFTVSLTATAYE